MKYHLRPTQPTSEHKAFISADKAKTTGSRAIIWIGHFYECDIAPPTGNQKKYMLVDSTQTTCGRPARTRCPRGRSCRRATG